MAFCFKKYKYLLKYANDEMCPIGHPDVWLVAFIFWFVKFSAWSLSVSKLGIEISDFVNMFKWVIGEKNWVHLCEIIPEIVDFSFL